ncbi:MAG: hypothetical protein HYX51_00220 [Chloroflexi bacterium]|nr:hypothetical protein [Chloroflexota bacterium]
MHGMNLAVESNRQMVDERIRNSSMAAESMLHEKGAISIINSDSQGMGRISASFVSEAAASGDFARRVATSRKVLPVKGTRGVGKRHMLYNQSNPTIAIHPTTGDVLIDGAPLPPLPTDDLPLNRRYMLL